MDFSPIILWWLVITLFGLVGWPLAFSLLRQLPDRGFALARPVGLLLVGYGLWLGGSLRLLQNNIGGVLAAVLAALALAWWWRRQQQKAGDITMLVWLKQEWRYVVGLELLFHLAFVGWAIFKAYNPNIETAGGEKWMEIAFINGTLRSDYFPPQDPWLSGFGISYYYFGYVLMAMLTRLTGLISTVAFNLYIPTLFALTLTAAAGIVANLVSLHQNQLPITNYQLPIIKTPAIATGFLAALFVGIMGNLQGLLEVLHKRGLLPLGFWQWLDMLDLREPPDPTSVSWIPDRFIWWWRGSRVILDYTLGGREQEIIDEFPFFSFLLGDVHPHVLALPFVLLVIALALNLVVSGQAQLPQTPDHEPWSFSLDRLRATLETGWRDLLQATGGWLPLLIYAIALGGLSFLNTWDFPIYLVVVGLSLTVWLTTQKGSLAAALPSAVIGLGLLGLLGVLLYFPFYATFQSQARGFLPNLWNPTWFPQYFVFFGPFLVASLGLLLVLSGRYQGWRKHLPTSLILFIAGPLLATLILLSGTLISSAGRDFVQGILNNPEVQQVIGQASIGALVQTSLLRRVTNPWTLLIVGGLVAWVAALLLAERRPDEADEAASATAPTRLAVEKFVLILLLAGLGLTLTVEFMYLRDNFGYRLNTVFKFYFQAWVLLALASAFAVYYVSQRGRGWPVALWQGVLILLVAGGLVYPVLATADKTNYFQNEPTLNGIRWVSQARPAEYAAIAWLREHAVADNAVILEAPGAGYAAYQYTGRVSALTGLPTLLGWGGHQSQWRGNYDEPARREPDIDLLFNTLDLGQMQQLLDKYGITYVYVGPLERERYAPRGLEKFAQTMDVVFQEGDVTIYQRRS